MENETNSPIIVPDGLQYFRLLQLVLAGVYAFMSLSFFFHCVVAVGMIQIIKKSADGTVQNFVYVLTLTIVDAFVLSHLPLLVVEIVESRWIFGLNWCRYFWIAESVNKILSTFILTALCFDRYLLICFPRQSMGGLRSSATSIVIITMCVIAAFGLLSPIYLSAKVGDVGESENETVYKCVVDWSEDAEQKFTLSLFVVGYCIPLLMMTFFYSRIIIQLRKRAKLFHNGNVNSRTRTVTKRSFALVLFYFVCWTPFWVMSLFISNHPEPSDYVIITFYCLHGLVYLNSAMNPVFYALLNRELRKQQTQQLRVHAHRFIRLREFLIGSVVSTDL